ncbi:MAG: hypothetical protein ABI912_11360 [Actinomycetota bacterium]
MSGPESFQPGGRPGVRANAIPAGTFSRLRVVDARVSEALLDVLEDAGVAAYAEPYVGEVGAYRDVRSPSGPSDELYVDATRRDVAAGVVDAELPGMLAELEPVDPDEAFASIVATFHDGDLEDSAPWPAIENTTAAASDLGDHDDEWYATTVAADPEDEYHFVPPPPPPLPRLSGGKLWGVVMLIGGFVLMAGLPHLGFDPDDAMIIGIGTTVAGAATLVWAMRDAPSDSDPDDGAIV